MSLASSNAPSAPGSRRHPDINDPQPSLQTQEADWVRSDDYHNSFLVKKDEHFIQAVEANKNAGLPDIAVSEAQGKFLHLLVRSIGVKRVLEVGTLGGYSSIWFAKALPADGKLVTLEINPVAAKTATENIKNAGLGSKATVILGPALESLSKLSSDEPFDLAFIDADKQNNKNYFQEAERLVRPGGVIIVDNVVRRGRVADPDINDEAIEGTRSLLRYIQGNTGVEATTIATVGAKGYDGFLYALKNE